MSAIQIHLEFAERDALQRYAEALGVSKEDVAYAALNRLMLRIKTAEEEVDRDVVEMRDWRRRHLSSWSESSSLAQLYEGGKAGGAEPDHWRF